jgi:hypothetical protein
MFVQVIFPPKFKGAGKMIRAMKWGQAFIFTLRGGKSRGYQREALQEEKEATKTFGRRPQRLIHTAVTKQSTVKLKEQKMRNDTSAILQSRTRSQESHLLFGGLVELHLGTHS